MNVVDAINAWIDEQIDDLLDDELEEILEVLDVVTLSEFAELDADDVDEDDIYAMVDLVDGDEEMLVTADQLLRVSLLANDGDLDDTKAPTSDLESDPYRGRDTQDLNPVAVAEVDLDDPPSRLIEDDLFTSYLDPGNLDAGTLDRDAEIEDGTEDLDLVAGYLDTDSEPPETAGSEAQDGGEDLIASYLDDDPDGPQDEDGYLDIVGDDVLADEAGTGSLEKQPVADELTAVFTAIFGEAKTRRRSSATKNSRPRSRDEEIAPIQLGDTNDEPLDDDLEDDASQLSDTDHEPQDNDHGPHDNDAESQDTDDTIQLSDTDDESQDTDELDGLEETVVQAAVDLDDTREISRVWLPEPKPVPLVPTSDGLGPSFLEPDAAPVEATLGIDTAVATPWKRYGLVALLLAGLVAFVFGTIQLISSLDEEVASEAAQPTAVATVETPQPTLVPTVQATAIPAASPDDEAQPTPIPEPDATVVLRLLNGDVVVATLGADGASAETTTLYEPSASDALAAASAVSWLGNDLGIVDVDGNVLTVVPGEDSPTMIYEAGDELAPARGAVKLLNRVAIWTADGSIVALPRSVVATPDNLEVIWDADVEGTNVVGIGAIKDLLPFVLDDGNAKMVVASADDLITDIWSVEQQPPVFNVTADASGILFGVGQGAVAQYRLGEVEGPRIISVWDPFSTDETPAIGYSTAGSRVAVVLADGAIVLADDTGTGEKLWDPEVTELRALAVTASAKDVIVLLETGSVVRIPLSGDRSVAGSLWDITDETLNPATQVLLRPTE